eukprot:Skav207864  [mRNA]  locus=scaffold1988:105637:107126:+ [translate_table: standard]
MAFVRSFRRCAEKAWGNGPCGDPVGASFTPQVPDVFMQFGLEQQFRFVSHPGIFVENIEKMKMFDPELARKAQIAYDNKAISKSMWGMVIQRRDILPRLLEEKKQLEVLCGPEDL